MLSWEIDKYLKEHNFELISNKQVAEIMNDSPQANRLKYAGSDKFYAYYLLTTDDGFTWNFRLEKNRGTRNGL